jgi:hypothetical protein
LFGHLAPIFGGCTEDIFKPPWRSRLATGELSPPYGPSGIGALALEMRAFRFSKAGGGLWDREREYRRPAPPPVKEMPFMTVAEYIRLRGATLPPDELAAGVLWSEGRGRVRAGGIARRMGVPVERAERLLDGFIRGWHSANAR